MHNSHQNLELPDSNLCTGHEFQTYIRTHASCLPEISCLPIRRPLYMPEGNPDAGCHIPAVPIRPDADTAFPHRDHEDGGFLFLLFQM